MTHRGDDRASRHSTGIRVDGCKDDRVVVDVVSMNKGHTEGLEPKITEAVIKYMQSAKGGKLQGD